MSSISVLGIKFGDSQESISTEIITEGPYIRWLHTSKGFTIRLSDSEPRVVMEFFLKSEVLGELKLTKERRIERRFGKALATEQKRGITYYFYESRKIIVAWNNSKNQLLGIYFGELRIKQTQFRVKDFLDKFFEFKRMVPNANAWNTNALRYNEPRYYRLKQLEALMRAFDIGDDLAHDFQNRNFLKNRSIKDLDPIMDDIKKYAINDEFEEKRLESETGRLKHPGQFEMLIQSFMNFSEEMRRVLSFNSGWLETGGITSRYSIYKTQKLLDNIDLTELEEIESLLGKLLDPKNRVFTQSELIKDYGFPDVDLEAIDMDNY